MEVEAIDTALESDTYEDEITELLLEQDLEKIALPNILYYTALYSIPLVPPKRKEKKEKYNYFLAVRINGAPILSKVNELQNQLRTSLPSIPAKDFIKLDKLHITLFVMIIKDNETLQSVLQALKDSATILKEYFESTAPSFTLKGVGTFGNRVLWAGLEDGPAKEKLIEVVGKLKEHIKAAVPNLVIENKPFAPHITILKSRGRKRVKIEESTLAPFQQFHFGEQLFESIDLLAMEHKDNDGYYKRFGVLQLGGNYQFQLLQPQLPSKTLQLEQWMAEHPQDNFVAYYLIVRHNYSLQDKNSSSRCNKVN